MSDRPAEARYRLVVRPGTPVISGNEQVGKVDRLIVEPSSGRIAGLLVREGLLLLRDVFVPIEAVERSDESAVHVRPTVEELNRDPAFAADRDDAPGGRAWTASASRLQAARSGQLDAESGGLPIRAGQRVDARDGKVGSLDVVLIDPRTRRATAIVVRRGLILARDTIVPVELVREISDDRIVLDVDRDALAELPEYRPDDEIAADVLDALWYRSDLDPAELHFVEVRTRDGVVELVGHTVTEAARAAIEEAAWRVKGVLGVRNYLDTFEALEAEIRRVQRRAQERSRPGAEGREPRVTARRHARHARAEAAD